jgi:hypothetical protein
VEIGAWQRFQERLRRKNFPSWNWPLKTEDYHTKGGSAKRVVMPLMSRHHY